MEKTPSFFGLVVLRIMKPIVRLMVKNRLPYKSFAEYVKWLYIEVCKEEFSPKYKKINFSKLSAVTGFSRKEVRRLITLEEPDVQDSLLMHNKVVGVINLWTNSPAYCDENNHPLDLPLTGEKPSFASLVSESYGDLPYQTILDDLISTNSIEETDDHQLKLTRMFYIPKANDLSQWNIIGLDTSDLLNTIIHNFYHVEEGSKKDFLQLKATSLDIDEGLKDKLRILAKQEGIPWLQKLDAWMTEQIKDLDEEPVEKTNEESKNKKFRAGIGIYYFEEEMK